jgi:hypothetical protein
MRLRIRRSRSACEAARWPLQRFGELGDQGRPVASLRERCGRQEREVKVKGAPGAFVRHPSAHLQAHAGDDPGAVAARGRRSRGAVVVKRRAELHAPLHR